MERFAAILRYGGARRPRRPLDRRARRRLRERRAVGDLRRRLPDGPADGHARRPAPRDGRVYARVDGHRRQVDVIYRRSNYHLLRDEDGSPSALAEKLLEPIRQRHRDRRQPARRRDRRRQARPRLRRGHDPLLPRRGAGARPRALLRPDRRGRARGRARPAGGDGGQGPRPRRRRGRADRRGGRVARARTSRRGRRTSSPRSSWSSRATRRCSTASWPAPDRPAPADRLRRRPATRRCSAGSRASRSARTRRS